MKSRDYLFQKKKKKDKENQSLVVSAVWGGNGSFGGLGGEKEIAVSESMSWALG